VDAGFNVGFSPDEKEKISASLGNKIYGNDIPRRNSIKHTRGHKSRQSHGKKQETDGLIGIWSSSMLRQKKTRLKTSSFPFVISCDFPNAFYFYYSLVDAR
jgi:hypothetical protein